MTVGNDPMSIAVQGAALVSLVWSCAVFLVQTIGITQLYGLPLLFRSYRRVVTATNFAASPAPASVTTFQRVRSQCLPP